MKLLFDENLSGRLVERLRSAYPGSTHVDLVGLHGSTDAQIWEFAAREGYTIVSKDNIIGGPLVIDLAGYKDESSTRVRGS